MGFSLVPKIRLESIYELTPELLAERGISLLMLDLDNTLAPYSGSAPTERLFRWRDDMLRGGITLFIVSNTKTDRAKSFAAKWQVPYVDAAKSRARGALTKRCGSAQGSRLRRLWQGISFLLMCWGQILQGCAQ